MESNINNRTKILKSQDEALEFIHQNFFKYLDPFEKNMNFKKSRPPNGLPEEEKKEVEN